MSSNIRDPHPAFTAMLMMSHDPKTDIFVRVARYRTDHVDYTGGDYVEVFDRHGDLLDDDFADAEPIHTMDQLRTVLQDAVVCFTEDA